MFTHYVPDNWFAMVARYLRRLVVREFALGTYGSFAVMSVMTTWNPMTHADYDLLKGVAVVSADNQDVGSITEILHPNMEMPAARGHHYFLLDPGVVKDWFGGFDKVYLPESVIESVSAKQVVLNLTADQIKQRSKGWTRQPEGLKNYRRV
jgi:hypothetical protein